MAKRKRDYSDQHRVWNLAIARVYCSCGWVWQNHQLKGKSDEMIQRECMAAWVAHSKE